MEECWTPLKTVHPNPNKKQKGENYFAKEQH